MYYVIKFTPGPNWEKGKPMNEQKLSLHRAYYQSLIELDKVVISGGIVGDREGISILNVNKESEAESICKEDPAIKSGIFFYHIKPMYAVFRGLNSEQLDTTNL